MLRSIFCSSLMLFAGTALANGYVTPTSTHDYFINLDKADIQNKPDATKTFDWNLKGKYSGTVSCPEKSIPASPVYYKATMLGGLPQLGDGFVKLNEFLDMKVEVWIAGRKNKYVTAPFVNESNEYTRYSCTKGRETRIDDFESGSKGLVTFRVRKQIINGVQISDRQVVEMYGRLGYTSTDFNNIPMSRITITSAILYVPEECVINGGQTIEVEFGDLPGTGLDGNNFEKAVPLTFQCKGGAFEGDALKINLGLSGRPASFSQDYLRTTSDSYTGNQVIPDLGIKFKQLDGSPLQLNKFYPVSMQGNIGDWGFIAAPVTPTGADIPAGDFYATATIVAEFQ
ncbi:TPA: fimbrial protein [Aeromonas hydrophila]|uniref:Fimbrial protein n=1 Tax=Aeromonas hydrophila TaxID=644 RepID=A0AAD3UAT7_AERHY|nr:fimbrial protein [Aeromonas hydrophila]MBL0562160.1 fimbrial protein [Aeromonas hydrophila]HAT6344354.1 fimbrial protein [Aeromonas hydrophila]